MGERDYDRGRERPRCIAIAICNEIIEDVRTHNKTLVSLFNAVHASSLPAVHPRMYVMGSFTDGQGRWPILLRISDPDNEEMMKVEGEVEFQDPLGVCDLVFEILNLPLRKPGVHFVDVFAGGEHIAGRRFTVQSGGSPGG